MLKANKIHEFKIKDITEGVALIDDSSEEDEIYHRSMQLACASTHCWRSESDLEVTRIKKQTSYRMLHLSSSCSPVLPIRILSISSRYSTNLFTTSVTAFIFTMPSDPDKPEKKTRRERRTREGPEQTKHYNEHGFLGPPKEWIRLPWVMPIKPTTENEVVAMWLSIAMFCACGGWLACSLIGFMTCRFWKITVPPDRSWDVAWVFEHYPLNRWAVNVVVSGIMTVYFFINSIIFGDFRARLSRAKQWEDAENGKLVKRREPEEENRVSFLHYE